MADKIGQVAVVTGGAQGIGRRVAEVLAQRGYSLAINDLRMPGRYAWRGPLPWR